MIDSRIKPHDANQLELKLSYRLAAKANKQRYLVEAFIFVPRTLGINPASYTAQSFFQDAASLVRLTTPRATSAELAQRHKPFLLFEKLQANLATAVHSGEIQAKEIAKQLKLCGAIIRATVRDECRLFKEQLRTAKTEEVLRKIESHLMTMMDNIKVAVEILRSIARPCELMTMPAVICDTWAVVNEYISITTEERMTILVAACDKVRKKHTSELSVARETMADYALAEYEYRMSRGYPSYVKIHTTNEDLPRRHRILKRVVASVLFLDTTTQRGGEVQRDVIAGLAAAIAMFFAIIVTLWAQIELNQISWAFVGIMVGSYIIKDRLKDWGKRYIGRRMGRFLPDRIVTIKQPDRDEVIGKAKESAGVVSPDRLEPEIFALRHFDHPSPIASDGRPEMVIRYEKRVILRSSALQQALPGVEGLSDIIRFSFARLRQRMDEPIENLKIISPETRKVITIPCHRIYHINLILRMTAYGNEEPKITTERVRVLVDADGIKTVKAIRYNPAGDHLTGVVK